MNSLKYILFLTLFFIIANYLLKDIVKESFSVNVKSSGEIKNYLEKNEPIPQNFSASPNLIKDLENDVQKFASNGNSIQNGGSNSTSNCDICYNLLPGSPGANQYNYGVSVDCKCKGITGDMLNRCGKVTTFNQNELAIKDNFQKSTPEVINKLNENWIPPHMITQLHYVGPYKKEEVVAANQNVLESPCNFTSQKTNLEQYFKANPDLYLDTDKYSTFKPFVPFTSAWEEQSDCYNNTLAQRDSSIPGHFLVNKI